MNFFIENWQTIISLLGGLGAFVTGWNVRKINAKEQEAGALQSVQKVYDTLTKQIDPKFAELFNEIKNLKNENIEQRKDMRILQEDNRNLHTEVSKLLKRNHELEKENTLLINTTPNGSTK
jgi:predicted RNase H-like nuclease (RuvC/YqgF family)